MPSRTRPKPSPASPADAPRLTRDDWLAAAHAAVVEGGFDQLRVLLIAKALGVTRGSFYWHFSDHAELQAELLAGWRQRQLSLIDQLHAPASSDPQAELERVLEAALAHAGTDLEHMRFELALRGLGRRDAAVARLLAEVDALRLQLFVQKFQQLVVDPAVALDLARLFYLAVVGSHQALARPGNPPQLKGQLKRLIGTYLVARQAPSGVAAPAAARRRARA